MVLLPWGLECFEWGGSIWIKHLLFCREDIQLLLAPSHLPTWGRSHHWFCGEFVLTDNFLRFHAFTVLKLTKVFFWLPVYFDFLILWFSLSFSVGSWICSDFIAAFATNKFLYERWNAIDSSGISLIFNALVIITQACFLVVCESCISICINWTLQWFSARCIQFLHGGSMFCVQCIDVVWLKDVFVFDGVFFVSLFLNHIIDCIMQWIAPLLGQEVFGIPSWIQISVAVVNQSLWISFDQMGLGISDV